MLERRNFTKIGNWIGAVLMDFIGYSFIGLIVNRNQQMQGNTVKRVLVIRRDGIGDAIVTMPLFRALNTLFPEAEIHCLIKPGISPVFEFIPGVDTKISPASLWGNIFLAFKYRKAKYDIIINPRPDGYLFGHLIAFIMNGRRRVGYAMKGGGFLLTDIVKWEGEKNVLRLTVSCLQPFAAGLDVTLPEISTVKDEDTYILKLLAENGIAPDEPVIGINPYAGHQMVWTDNKWSEVIHRTIKQTKMKVVIMGEKKHQTAIAGIKKKTSGAVALAGKTNLAQLVSLIKRCKVLITVDSGPRHIANAVKTPAIVLRNGANSRVIWGRYAKTEQLISHTVACAPCGKCHCPEEKRTCMTSIGVDEVLALASPYLQQE